MNSKKSLKKRLLTVTGYLNLLKVNQPETIFPILHLCNFITLFFQKSCFKINFLPSFVKYKPCFLIQVLFKGIL